MFSFLVGLALCLTGSVYTDDGVNWVLLVAGSNQYYNYRHQADICHAYQIMHRNGIPDERIVVMMYDDIAYNQENPMKGQIINQPGGKDVYNGTLKDYTKKLVTPSNFLKVLKGESVSVGSGKIIKSGPNDNIFVYFADHGAPGIIAFPDGSALHASDLNKAIKSMHQNNQYKNMVFYIEACESGSMFENLLADNINVYATTAANSQESSYACYYDSKLRTYLGDLYSVNWMEDSDREDIFSETLKQQFEIVKNLTNSSHVTQFGDLQMGLNFKVSDFQAEKGQSYKPTLSLTRMSSKTDVIKAEDVRMSILQKRLTQETDQIIRQSILSEMKEIQDIKTKAINVIQGIAKLIAKRQNLDLNDVLVNKKKLTNHECYKPVIDHLIQKCFSLKNDYVLRNLYVLVNLCESGVESQNIIYSINRLCPIKHFD
ncbi:legumain [Brachionus plicatilis]|uniref:Hemoglobinase n=1 Tax=Brachionus plicatilis TaxID=10195 RepID=A0A3M7P547_BRAPC|nr:legumain [Brachionus plicatilis]